MTTVLTAQGPVELAPHKAAPIGHNAPADKFTLFAEHADELLAEAMNYLDGEGVQDQAQADDVSRILSMLRRTGNDADEARKDEKRPHDEAAKVVQTKWKPLLDKIDLAASTAKNALAPFLRKQEEAQRAAVEAAAQEARRQAEAAAQAAREARPDDLAGQTTARILQESAAAAEKLAAKLDKAKPQAKGGERAVGLRSVWTPTLTDSVAALKHYRERQPEELKAWLLEQAERDVRAGQRAIPGFEITEQRIAV